MSDKVDQFVGDPYEVELHRKALATEAASAPVPEPQPTPTVAKIAAEIAPDLEDFVEFDVDGLRMNYTGYRCADAQEMIERAFAGFTYTGEQA